MIIIPFVHVVTVAENKFKKKEYFKNTILSILPQNSNGSFRIAPERSTNSTSMQSPPSSSTKHALLPSLIMVLITDCAIYVCYAHQIIHHQIPVRCCVLLRASAETLRALIIKTQRKTWPNHKLTLAWLTGCKYLGPRFWMVHSGRLIRGRPSTSRKTQDVSVCCRSRYQSSARYRQLQTCISWTVDFSGRLRVFVIVFNKVFSQMLLFLGLKLGFVWF